MRIEHQNRIFPASQYRALDPDLNEIRLIQVDPLITNDPGPDNGFSQVVRCRLKHVSLNDSPNYTALSYVWGDPTITRTIIVDDQPVQVTENLESALRHLATGRWHDAELGWTLWVDAICIDQHNSAERTQQVSLMKAIFRSAFKTLIWLGPTSEDSRLAFNTLERLSRKANVISRRFPTWAQFPFSETTADPLVAAVQNDLEKTIGELCADDSAALKAISSLFDRPWFRRVWVIQERVLSLSPFVCCGTRCITWATFFGGFWLICGLRDYLNFVGSITGRSNNSALAAVLTAALDRVTPVAFTQSRSSFLSLFSLLSRMAAKAQLQASDQRDYVFALLGLIDRNTSPLIPVEYDKSWAAVRVNVAKACLAYYGPRLLSFAGYSNDMETAVTQTQYIPSWAPDWSSERLPQPLSVDSIFVVRGQYRPRAYSASAGAVQDLSWSFSVENRLSLAALLVDYIEHVGSPFIGADDEYVDDTTLVASLDLWLRDFETMLLCPNEIYQTAESISEALWRTPIADRAFAYNWERERASAQTLSAYRALRAGEVAKGVKYAHIASVKLHRTCPFRSAKGYVGLGPLRVSRGDSIWIIPGSDVPFVLRPSGCGGFHVIGEAYVHGIMDGEFLQKGAEHEKIELV
ncbi:heterokaryon incompatibility protein [Colletotrichum truncatum]|uniref:Heterokaryon incompatibility protein n=1 Tax=Colletotrichum truncatum TaxID=5467 RepID=A0ACC3YJT1_COLTU|nr:heterokaryon incompatibility protein [Colletotrichum truncatum]KAF6797335.1 heterokaryon incompatibility protein [Colletotrichum truncatum]